MLNVTAVVAGSVGLALIALGIWDASVQGLAVVVACLAFWYFRLITALAKEIVSIVGPR